MRPRDSTPRLAARADADFGRTEVVAVRCAEDAVPDD